MSSNPESIKLLGKVLHFGHMLGFTPYSWSSLNSRVEYNSSICRRIWQALLLTGLVLYHAFLGLQCYRVQLDPQADLQSKIRIMYVTCTSYLILANQYAQIFLAQEYVEFLNRFMALMTTPKGFEGGTKTDL